jgi:hypothetical protein
MLLPGADTDAVGAHSQRADCDNNPIPDAAIQRHADRHTQLDVDPNPHLYSDRHIHHQPHKHSNIYSNRHLHSHVHAQLHTDHYTTADTDTHPD